MAAENPKEEFSRFLLPGFTLPLTFEPGKRDAETRTFREGEGGKLFRSALDHNGWETYAGMPLTTLREFTMLRLMNQLTDKPGWETKVFDETIAGKWKTEAINTEGGDVTEAMANYVIDELRYKAEIFKKTGAVNVYDGDVVKSDNAIPEDLRQQLKGLAAGLEDVPEAKKDYHPGSDEQVLDLVHPSLFPLIYGRSRILPNSLVALENCIDQCGTGVITQVPPELENTNSRKWGGAYSRNFQWLPSEVEFVDEGDSSGLGEEGRKCKISSYINNLHPHRHPDLYRCIEQILGRIIPQWNRTLGPLKRDEFDRVDSRRIRYRSYEFDETPSEPEPEEDETDSDFEERRDDWYDTVQRTAIQPEPEEFHAPENGEEQFDLQKEFGHRGLQVIVKLANIHLTPEKPKYAGGTWHVEGQKNEHICTTALYYYDSENITESRLAFRQQVDTDVDISYEQDRHEFLPQVFGCEKDDAPIQDVGDVLCRQGRVITFPNVLQHQVQPFELEDASRPGHRKILALFLVDPNIRVISTANVPPQQRDWWWERVQRTDTALDRLPAELQEVVAGAVEDFPISMEEAKEIRLQLMEERKTFQSSQTRLFSAGSFSLCEH